MKKIMVILMLMVSIASYSVEFKETPVESENVKIILAFDDFNREIGLISFSTEDKNIDIKEWFNNPRYIRENAIDIRSIVYKKDYIAFYAYDGYYNRITEKRVNDSLILGGLTIDRKLASSKDLAEIIAKFNEMNKNVTMKNNKLIVKK